MYVDRVSVTFINFRLKQYRLSYRRYAYTISMYTLSTVDWFIVAIYLSGLIVLSVILSRKQNSRKDYYVAGYRTGPWPIAISTMATQCSTC